MKENLYQPYKGALADPILRSPTSLLDGSSFPTDEEIFAARLEKLGALFGHFNLPIGDWPALAFALALQHVPGLQVRIDEREEAPYRLRGLATIATLVRRFGLADSDAQACRVIAEMQMEAESELNTGRQIKRKASEHAINQRQKTLKNKVTRGRRIHSTQKPPSVPK